jgi:transposase
MSAAIPITRSDMTASELRSFAGKGADGAQVRRLLALAMVLEGRSRSEAAELNGMDRQTLSDWVHRYNATDVDGLKWLRAPGAAPLLNEAQKSRVARTCRQRPGSREGQCRPLALRGFTGGNRSSVFCPGA